MNVSVKVESGNFRQALNSLTTLLGETLWEPVIKEEATQIIKGAIRYDSSLTVAGSKFGVTARAVRERMVSYYISRTMNPLRPEALKDSKFRKAIGLIVSSGDMGAAQAFFDRIKRGRFRGTQIVGFSAQLHRANINRATGRTRNTGFRLMGAMDWIKYDAYVKQVQGRVGWKYAGFSPAAANLGFTLPQWVSRHASAPGSFSAEASRSGKITSLTVVNSALTNDRFGPHIARVMEMRARAMLTKISRIIDGEAVNLGFGTLNKNVLTLKSAYTSLDKARREEISI